ncbi:MAG: hypothetical protein KA715_04075 [Xanthomonadaceae bacterium]|nr:hypothetical protein [Xanthomonadaceae bacterium]
MDQKKLDVNDTLKTAQILRNEGLFEDAKHTLRKLISQFPDDLRARTQLEEIQKEELTLIMKEVQTGIDKPRSRFAPPPKILVEDSDSIIQKLNRDLNLGLVAAEKKPHITISLRKDKLTSELSVKDRIDLGIGFLQMNLYVSAIDHFRIALTQIQKRPESYTHEIIVSVIELLCTAYVEGGEAFDAVLLLEATLSDNLLPGHMKIGLMYWMARAQLKVSQKEIAIMWFEEVKKRDSEYRDVEYRLRTLGQK